MGQDGLIDGIGEPRSSENTNTKLGARQTDTATGGDTGGEVKSDREDLAGVVGLRGGDRVEAGTNGSLHVASLAIRTTEGSPEVDPRRRVGLACGSRASANREKTYLGDEPAKTPDWLWMY